MSIPNPKPDILLVETDIDIFSVKPEENELKRCRFVMNVYGVLCICITITIIHVYMVLNWADFRNCIATNFWILYMAIFGYSIGVMIIAGYIPVPRNRVTVIITFLVVVESMSIICSTAIMYHVMYNIMSATVGTSVIWYLATVVTILKPMDTIKCTYFLAVIGILSMVIVLISVVSSLFKILPIFQITVTVVIIMVFANYMIFTTQLIMRDRTFHIENDFLPAAISLYVDIAIIFLNFLNVFDLYLQ